VVRTRRPSWSSRPGRLLLILSLAMMVVAMVLPFVPGAHAVELVPLPLALLASMAGITILYVGATEVLKRVFYGRGDRAVTAGSSLQV
jgi:Mg2+-importing ATPase